MTQSHPSPNTDAALQRARTLLSERFGHEDFLPGQEESLGSIYAGRNLLVVMPTGSGKSLLYQLPALEDGALTLVVSPLISLMKDQVDELTRRRIPAAFVNSSLSLQEQRQTLSRCVAGEVKLLYVAPERFRNASFLGMLSVVKVGRLAVDEAHCISEWGHDFRPDYRRLKDFRERMGHPLVTALTATATPRVQQDIIESLGLAPDEADVHVHGFDRPNLVLRVKHFTRAQEKDDFVLDFVRRHAGSGIIYTGTRRAAEETAELIEGVEPTVAVYHAGMEPENRVEAQEAFLSGRARIVTATNAFGMGIDKADVRFVLHTQYPGSVEQYYQEIGRAGRDGIDSDCVLLYAPGDRRLREFFIDLNYPARNQVKDVYETLWDIPDNPVVMTYAEIAGKSRGGLKDGQVGAAVRLLDGAGVTRAFAGEPCLGLTLNRPAAVLLKDVKGAVQRRVLEALSVEIDLESPGRFEVPLRAVCAAAGLSEAQVRRSFATMDRAGLLGYEPPFRGRGIQKLMDVAPPFHKLEIDWGHQQRLRKAEEDKLNLMEEYVHATACRRGFILHYFGESEGFRCGTCDSCRSSGKGRSPGVLERSPAIAGAVLCCVQNLRFPLGKIRVSQVLTGSSDKNIIEWGLDRNPAYGLFRNSTQKDVCRVVDEVIREGYLRYTGEMKRRVLSLTPRGERAVPEASDVAQPVRPPALQRETDPARQQDHSTTEVRLAALRCVEQLPIAVGLHKIAAVLGGSKAEWVERLGADRLDVYESVRTSQEEIRQALEKMLAEGLLSRSAGTRPTLGLTEAGRELLERPRPQAPTVPALVEPSKPGEDRALDEAGDPAGLLDDLLDELMTAERERASRIVETTRVFHPAEIVRQLARRFRGSATRRTQARAVWAAGELGGLDATEFLIECTRSTEYEVRRLAASAIGKVASNEGESSAGESLSHLLASLQPLLKDQHVQVRRYAEKAIARFPSDNAPE